MKTFALFALLVLVTPACADDDDLFPEVSGSPRIYSSDGKFLGNFNRNRYDPDSIANEYGRYGSEYEPDSVNNPYGRYGSRYSPEGIRNKYGIGR